MASQVVLVLCAQLLLIQQAFGQCYGSTPVDTTRYTTPYGLNGRSIAYDLPARGVGLGCTAMEITPTSGGALIVASGSDLPPVGIFLASENVYEGNLCAAGELPFVGTVGVDGVVHTAGAGAVNYSCGDGVTAMESVADVAPAIGFGEYGLGGYGAAGLGYRPDLAGRGCGYVY